MNKFEDHPSNLGWYVSQRWWWIRVLLMVAFAIMCAVLRVPIPAVSSGLFFGALMGLFVLTSIYPLLTAYIATKLPSYLEIPWDRLQWTKSPFAMHGPLHGPHFIFSILFAGSQGTIVGDAYNTFVNDSQSTSVDGTRQALVLFATSYGLWIGISAAQGIFVDAYRDELNTEANLSTRRTAEIAVGLMWLFVLVAIPVTTLGMVIYLR